MRAASLLASLFIGAIFVGSVVAAPPEKESKPAATKPKVAEPKATEPKAAAAKPQVSKPSVKPATPPVEKVDSAKPDSIKPTAAKPDDKKPAAATPSKETANPNEAIKPNTVAKPAVRKPTRVDPADNATQPIFASTAKPAAPKPLTPGGKYPAGDMKRPRPLVVSPATESSQQQPGRAPSDAIVLFDGTGFDHWKREGGPKPTEKEAKPSDAPLWVIKNGYMECAPRSGGIGTREMFGDCQLHIEWATPSVVKGSSQGRGNSGVLLQGIGEVQVLDSYENDTYPDGQAAAIYSKYPPLVNASRRPGEWQTYDIVVELAKIDPATKQVVRPARLTVIHNGVLVHHAVEMADSKASSFKFALQDHGNPVRYRNIWLRPLKGYDAQ